MKRRLEWYIVRLVFQVFRNEQPTPEFDIQFRVIRADEEGWAFEKAQIIGTLEESTFYNNVGQRVSWKFVGLTEMTKLSGLDDASLVYSETEVTTNHVDYRKLVSRKMARTVHSRIE